MYDRARIPVVLASACLLLALGVPASAEEAASVDAFVAEVLRSNPTRRSRTLARAAAAREADAAGLWPDPEAAVMLDNVPRRMEGEMPMVRYQLTQMIPWPGKLGLMETAAQRRSDAAQADERSQTLDLVRDAKRAYWMLFMNEGLRDVNRAGRGLLDTIVSAALARYGSGSGAHHEVVRAQVEQNAIDVEAIDLEGERVATVAMMNALRNLPATTAIPDASEPQEPPASEVPSPSKLEWVALQRRPELERMRAMRREEEAMASLSRRERYPDLMTSVWYNQMLGEPDTAGVMVGATIPLFSVARQTRRAEASDLRAESIGSDLAAMQNMIRFAVADAQRRAVTAQRTLDLIENVAAPRANQSFVASLAGYSTGTVDIVGVLEAWRALQAVERARVDALASRQIAIAELERAIGAPLSGVSR
jgi:outer membrane protein, heavy metal efflux system